MSNIFRRPFPAQEGRKNELRAVLWSYKNTFLAVGLFSFVVNMLLLVPAIYMLQIYDRVLTSRNQDTLVMLTVIMVLMYIGIGFLEWIRSQVLIRLGNSMDQRLSGKVFQAAFERSLRLGSANATQYFNDLTGVRQFLTGNGLFAFFDSPWTPIFIIVIFFMHPWLGIFSIFSALFLLGMAALTEFVSRKTLAEANRLYNSASAYAGANLRNAEAIEAMGMLGRVREYWYRKHENFLKLQAMASERASVISAITKAARLTFQSSILGLGAYLAVKNDITPGMMIAASILLGRALQPVEMAIGTWKQFIATRTSYLRLGEILGVLSDRQTEMSLPAPTGVLTVKNLIAGPPGDEQTDTERCQFRGESG